MSNMEHEPNNTEKVIWWAKVGGIVAAVVGVFRHAAELATGGAVVVAGAMGLEEVLFKRKQQANSNA